MKQPSVYLKMRVLGAVDTVEGRTRHERIFVLYLALIAFSFECCRIVIQLKDVCYTENLAKGLPRLR